jgi:integrase
MGTKPWPTGIRPNGSGIQIRVFRNGQQISEQIEGDPYNARDLAAAVKRREELVSRLKLGLPLFHGDDDALVIFKDAAQEYMDDLRAAYATHYNYEWVLNAVWLPAFAKWPVKDISTKAIKRVLKQRDLSNKTKTAYLSPLRGVLDHAEVSPNPARFALGQDRGESKAIARYTPEERQALVGALSGQARVFFAVLFGCGLRPGEALALRWNAYDGERLHITQTISKSQLKDSTKTYYNRYVYVPTWARGILNDHYTRPRQGWVFLTRFTKPYTSDEIFAAHWKAAHQSTGIAYRVPYTCRHTRAAELLSQGIAPGDAAKQMGHSLKTFIETYAEWIEGFAAKQDMSRFEGVAVDSNWIKSESQKGTILKFKGKTE